MRSRSMGGDHGATGFCKQLVAIDSHRTMPPARQAHVECGLLNVRVVVATRRPERGGHAFVTGADVDADTARE